MEKYISSQLCEFDLEYGVCGKEFNSKLGIYKQEWYYQAHF